MTDLSHIVKMVIYKCREHGNPVTETLAAYVAQTMLNKCKSYFLSKQTQKLAAFTSKIKSTSRKRKNSLN